MIKDEGQFEEIPPSEDPHSLKMKDSDYLGLFGPWLPKKYESLPQDTKSKMKFVDYVTMFKHSMPKENSEFNSNQVRVSIHSEVKTSRSQSFENGPNHINN